MIRFRNTVSGPVTGFGGFLTKGLTLGPHLALALTLYVNRAALLNPVRPEARLALALGGVALAAAVLSLALALRAARPSPGRATTSRRPIRGLALAMTALVWGLLVLLPATPLIAVLPLSAAMGGAGAWAASLLFTSANPRRVARMLDPRSAGHWVSAPDYEFNRHLKDHSRNVEDPGGRWPTGSLIATGVVLALAALGAFGALYPMWVPAPGLGMQVRDNARSIFAASAVLGALLGAAAGGYRTDSLLRWLGQKLAAAAVLSVVLALLAQPFLRVGLPYAASYATPLAPMRQEVSVARLGERHPRGGCRYSALVAYGEPPSQTAWICEIPAQIWDGLRPGDRLVLSGPGNGYGLRYDRIARAD